MKPARANFALAAAIAATGRIAARRAAVALAIALPIVPDAARADPNDYVITLDFAGGERELEAKMGAATSARDGTPRGEAAAFAWGLGVNDTWFTEAYVQFANSTAGASGGGLDAVSWENIVRFSEPGQWPVDVGAMMEIERPRAGSQGWKVTAGPLFQKDFDQFQVNANLLLERVYDGAPREPTQLTYQFQVRYRSETVVDFGAQALGEMGAWNHWGTPGGQVHRVGPALFGSRRLSPGSSLSYNAALLLGVSRGAADATLRAQVEYEY